MKRRLKIKDKRKATIKIVALFILNKAPTKNGRNEKNGEKEIFYFNCRSSEGGMYLLRCLMLENPFCLLRTLVKGLGEFRDHVSYKEQAKIVQN